MFTSGIFFMLFATKKAFGNIIFFIFVESK